MIDGLHNRKKIYHWNLGLLDENLSEKYSELFWFLAGDQVLVPWLYYFTYSLDALFQMF